MELRQYTAAYYTSFYGTENVGKTHLDPVASAKVKINPAREIKFFRAEHQKLSQTTAELSFG